ncbi:hypothetical protein [Komagataeibacter nataicola]|uniref:Thoeris protein ThsB TIR-like domain-containing protein n=1 Tax=Komagataeibacter nataicola TaxID=265960 RepID=A0ABX5PCJ5_9PROT|nr:hypothetical protein [Komagataeibacter nataicola]PYD65185.1 hypothetical protein CDI09_14915 [Komagataeibacter nataicola]WNM07540.1 hypothetical protein RI056_10535 [Komagataeibacter nataicola]GBR21916.1 hypothetical protein AA0616_2145 [Komagataeibacter nataicola NRIC 0616]
MADKRIFISFAMENKVLRDFLVGQKLNDSIDISFTDYSVKEPWSNSWKTNCRSRIKGCDGVIGIITNDTPAADGQLWELKCGYEEGVPTLLIHGYSSASDRLIKKPSEIAGKTICDWSVNNISTFLRGL